MQQYLESELIQGGDKSRVINVFRPPEEVFKKASLDSYLGTDITDDHPAKLVNSKNFNKLTVGTVISVGKQDKEEKDFVVVDMLIKKQQVIDKVMEGSIKELSAGYLTDYEAKEGITPKGEKYSFIQTNISINHLALVEKARAGEKAKVLDTGESQKMEKEKGNESKLQDEIKELKDELKELKKSNDEFKKSNDEIKVEKDEMQKSLDESKSKEEDEEEKAEKKKELKDTFEVFTKHQKMVKNPIAMDKVIEGKDTIIKNTLLSLCSKEEVEGKSKEYLSAMFDMEYKRINKISDQRASLGQDFRRAVNDKQEEKKKDVTGRDAYFSMIKKRQGDA